MNTEKSQKLTMSNVTKVFLFTFLICIIFAWPNYVYAGNASTNLTMMSTTSCYIYSAENSAAENRQNYVTFGEEVTVTSYGDKWCAVEYNGQTGYMLTKYLDYKKMAVNTTKASVNPGAFASTTSRIGYAFCGTEVEVLGTETSSSGVEYIHCIISEVYNSTKTELVGEEVEGYINAKYLEDSSTPMVVNSSSNIYSVGYGSSSSASDKTAAGSLTAGTEVEVLAENAIWSKISYNEETYYIKSAKLDSKTMQVTTKSVKQYDRPSTSSNILHYIYWNTDVTILGGYTNSLGVKYYYMEYNGDKGFIRAETSAGAAYLGYNMEMEVESNVNFRTAATTSSDVISTLLPGSKVTVEYANSSWAKVEYDGTTGYVSLGKLGYPAMTADGSFYKTAYKQYKGTASGTLSKESVSLVASNETYNYAYIMTESGNYYWTALDSLSVDTASYTLTNGKTFNSYISDAVSIIFGTYEEYADEVKGCEATQVGLTDDDEIYLYDIDGTYYVLSDGIICFNADSSYMFYTNLNKSTELRSITLNNVDTSNVTNMSYMFYNCHNLTDISAVDGWDISNVTDMKYLFYACYNLTEVSALSGWDTSSVTDMNHMFDSCSKLADISALAGWDTSNVTDMSRMFCSCHSLASTAGLSEWDTSNVKNMHYMFCDSENLADISGLAKWDTSNVTDMGSLFGLCESLADISALADWDTSNVTDMSCMFNYCKYMADISSLSGWNTSSATTMRDLFSCCYSLADMSALTDWDTSNVTDMFCMFYNCKVLTDLSPLAGWDTSNVANMSNMFDYCYALADVSPLAGWDVSNVSDMSYMFFSCSSLADISALAEWDTSNVTDMHNMFYYCENLSNISGLAEWDLSNVTDMKYLFAGCGNLDDISSLAQWDTSNVTNMSGIFQHCSSLTDIYALTKWDTSNVTAMSELFQNCSSLSDMAPISGWDTSNVTDMNSMFYQCTDLVSLDLCGWDTSSVTNMYRMFYGCTKLATIYGGDNWTAENVTNSDQMFANCTSLVGGAGTTYNSSCIDASYAHVDDGTDNPGYLTYKN